MVDSLVTFLGQYSRTRGFAVGVPTQFTPSPDGRRVLFRRSEPGGRECLWLLDVATGEERLVADPEIGGDDGESPEQRVARERQREQATGITAYATDAAVTATVFTVGGRLWIVDVASGAGRELPAAGPVFDPRLSPDAQLVAYVSAGSLRVIAADGTGDRALAEPEAPDVTYGLAEHVAAESMHRYRGFWWAPDAQRLVVARVDNRAVAVWYLTSSLDPAAPPVGMRYPAAGTANADVSLHILDLAGARLEVAWDRTAFEYVTSVHWDETALTVAVQNRAQTVLRALTVNVHNGTTEVEWEDTDAAWISLLPGTPARLATGALVCTHDRGDTRYLTIGGEPVTPAGLQVREVFDVRGDTVLFSASAEPTEQHVWRWTPTAGAAPLTDTPGVHRGRGAGDVTVIVTNTLDGGTEAIAHGPGGARWPIANHAETPTLTPRVELLCLGARSLRTAVLFPRSHNGGSLPVLMDPYGGPAGQRVWAAQSGYLLSQWFADQGFAVVIADGRGTPGRGPRWERTVHGNRSELPLEDQIEALHAAAERYPDLDLTRVGIRGWSYGGFLAALAVLRRPDVFHAAVAGAPVTDQRLYDTHWQERFLGHPDEQPEAYDRSSLLADAPNLRRPLMLIHGLRDDNVHAAHTMRLSAALVAAGRPHTVLPLPTASHQTRGGDVAANLLRLQARFLLDALDSRTV